MSWIQFSLTSQCQLSKHLVKDTSLSDYGNERWGYSVQKRLHKQCPAARTDRLTMESSLETAVTLYCAVLDDV